MKDDDGPVLDSPWLLLPEVVKYARSSKTEVLGALANGSLRGEQRSPGCRWRIHRDDVDAWLRGEPAPERAPRRFTRRTA